MNSSISEGISPDLDKRTTLPAVRSSHSLTVIFETKDLCSSHDNVLLVQWEEERDQALKETTSGNSLDQTSLYLVCSTPNTRLFQYQASECPVFLQRVSSISIPDYVEDLCDQCFYKCENLCRVTFGESSSIKRFGVEAFSFCALNEIQVPDSIEEICDKCFYQCSRLSRVTFGESSSLKRIGVEAFSGKRRYACPLLWIRIPDKVEEICDRCFSWCMSLSNVTLGESSSLKRIGSQAFMSCSLTRIEIPDSVEEICYMSFHMCRKLSCVRFGAFSLLKHVGAEAFSSYEDIACSFQEITIPKGVVELGDRCFGECKRLSRITFCEPSSLKRIGEEVFSGYDDTGCSLSEIVIPDSVEEIGPHCFYNCSKLSHVVFGKSSSLKRICYRAFAFRPLTEIDIPDSVEEICDQCFCNCRKLSRVVFGDLSVLKRIGVKAFSGCLLTEITIPESVEEVCDLCFSGCKSLSRVTIGKASLLKRVGVDVFSGCPVIDFVVPESLEGLVASFKTV